MVSRAAMAAAVAASSKACSLRAFEGLRKGEEAHQRSSAAQVAAAPPGPRRDAYAPLVVRANKKAPKRKQVILTADVEHVGKAGDMLTVKRGYFRNFLFPFGKAKPATADILKALQQEQQKAEAEKKKVKDEAEKFARQLQVIGGLKVRRKQGTGKTIFGSVTTQDIVDIIKANTQREVDKKDIELPDIRALGEYIAAVKLHPEVTASVQVMVVPK